MIFTCFLLCSVSLYEMQNGRCIYAFAWRIYVCVFKHEMVITLEPERRKVKCSNLSILTWGSNCCLCSCTLESPLIWGECLLESVRASNTIAVLLKCSWSHSLGISLQYRVLLTVYIWTTTFKGKPGPQVSVDIAFLSVKRAHRTLSAYKITRFMLKLPTRSWGPKKLTRYEHKF